MELVKFEIEVILHYSVAQLFKSKRNLEKGLTTSRRLKNGYIDLRMTDESIEEEKNILRICENLETLEVAWNIKEGEVTEFTDYGSICLN